MIGSGPTRTFNQLRLSLERGQHIGREADRRVPPTRDALADVADPECTRASEEGR